MHPSQLASVQIIRVVRPRVGESGSVISQANDAYSSSDDDGAVAICVPLAGELSERLVGDLKRKKFPGVDLSPTEAEGVMLARFDSKKAVDEEKWFTGEFRAFCVRRLRLFLEDAGEEVVPGIPVISVMGDQKVPVQTPLESVEVDRPPRSSLTACDYEKHMEQERR